MRVCPLDTCPVGVATQNPFLRERFSGKPEFVETFFEFIAQEVREILAQLGFRSVAEAVGHVEALNMEKAIEHWKASGMDLAPLLHSPELPPGSDRRCVQTQDHALDKALDNQLIELSRPALEMGELVRISIPIRNVNRTVGTMLGSEITRRGGLPDGSIDITLTGSAGQSFGAFIPRGLTLRLEGDANDYVGKGLSGGRIVIRPDRTSTFAAEEHTIAGNVLAYGATSGELFVRGRVGERFCVRNSGARAVVEAVGDHGCEYMTGGIVVVLGSTGRNFAAGMSGGIAYVLDLDPTLVNLELVDLEPLREKDSEVVRQLITEHVENTESTKGAELLSNWDASLARFTKIIPRDYRRVLEIEEQARARGEDPLVAIMSSI